MLGGKVASVYIGAQRITCEKGEIDHIVRIRKYGRRSLFFSVGVALRRIGFSLPLSVLPNVRRMRSKEMGTLNIQQGGAH